jgi:hypothetical protein
MNKETGIKSARETDEAAKNLSTSTFHVALLGN